MHTRRLTLGRRAQTQTPTPTALTLLMLLTSASLLAVPASPARAQDPPPDAALAHKTLSIYARLDTQHQALTSLLTTLKAEVPALTLALKDLTGLTLDLAQRAAIACLMAPVDPAEIIDLIDLIDLIATTAAVTKVESCLALLPVAMLNQLTTLPEDDHSKLLNVLATTSRIRIGLAVLTPRVEALGKESVSATLALLEVKAQAVLDYELTHNNPFASDAQKARAAATYAQANAALSDSERKLTQIAADLAVFPIDALTLGKQTHDALSAPTPAASTPDASP